MLKNALRYLQKQKDIHEQEALEHYGVKARQYDPRKKDEVSDTSTLRPFHKPKVEATILMDTEEKPRYYSTTSRPRKKRPQPPVESTEHVDVPTAVAQEKPKQQETKQKTASVNKGDGSSEILASLDEIPRRVFEAIPSDRAISMDKLMVLGYKINELIAATTVLEIKGLINSLPGNLYVRR